MACRGQREATAFSPDSLVRPNASVGPRAAHSGTMARAPSYTSSLIGGGMGSEHKGVRAAEPDEHLASPTLQCAELACNALPWQAQHVDHAPAGGQLSLTRTGAPRTARNHAPAARRDGRRGLGGTGLTAPRWQWCHETSVACSCNHLTLMCWSSASSSLAGTLTAAAAASLTSHASWSFSAAQLTTLAWHATCEGSVGKGAYQAGRQAA